jgi:hypothetical protein
MVQIGRGQALTSPKMQTLDTLCRYCCKSPKLPGANFPAARQSDPRPSIDIASITFPRSPVSLSLGDGPPHLYTKVASTARRIFGHQCKKTFATKSATSRLMQCSKTLIRSRRRRLRAALSGMVRLRAFTAVRLMTRSNLVGCSTGRSAGLIELGDLRALDELGQLVDLRLELCLELRGRIGRVAFDGGVRPQ